MSTLFWEIPNHRFLALRGSTRNPEPSIKCFNRSLRRPQSIGRDKPLRAIDASIQGVTLCPQRADKTNNGCGWLIATALAEAWDEASLSAQIAASASAWAWS